MSGPSWLDMKPREFDAAAPDVQLAMFGADSDGNTGPDLFDQDGADQ